MNKELQAAAIKLDAQINALKNKLSNLTNYRTAKFQFVNAMVIPFRNKNGDYITIDPNSYGQSTDDKTKAIVEEEIERMLFVLISRLETNLAELQKQYDEL